MKSHGKTTGDVIPKHVSSMDHGYLKFHPIPS